MQADCGQRTLEVDDDNRQAIDQIAAWLARDPAGKLNPDKSLWLMGDIGTGKTTLAQAAVSYAQRHWHHRYEPTEPLMTRVATAAEYCDLYATVGDAEFTRILSLDLILVDDLGVEPASTAAYGNKCCVGEKILLTRCGQRWEKATIVTTNLSFAEAFARYGNRALDRVGDNFNVVRLLGSSRRGKDGRGSSTCDAEWLAARQAAHTKGAETREKDPDYPNEADSDGKFKF